MKLLASVFPSPLQVARDGFCIRCLAIIKHDVIVCGLIGNIQIDGSILSPVAVVQRDVVTGDLLPSLPSAVLIVGHHENDNQAPSSAGDAKASRQTNVPHSICDRKGIVLEFACGDREMSIGRVRSLCFLRKSGQRKGKNYEQKSSGFHSAGHFSSQANTRQLARWCHERTA